MISIRQHIRAITALGVPLIIGQLGATVQQFADTAMVGHYGTLELSAAGFVGNLFNLVIFFMLGISYSTTPVVGASFGRQDFLGTARALRESLLLGLITSGVIIGGLTWLYFNIEVLDQPEELLPLARPYFLTLLLSLPFLAVFNSLKQFSDALGETRMPMWMMLWGNVLNILLNWLLIFGFTPGDWLGDSNIIAIPPLGLLGAGIATLLSRMFMAVGMTIAVFSKTTYSLSRGNIKAYELHASQSGNAANAVTMLTAEKVRRARKTTRRGLWRMTKLGIPISMQMCLEAASFNICAIFMGWIGAIPIAAHQIMCTISTFCFLLMYGIGAAAAVRISHFRGRGEWQQVRETAVAALALNACCSIITVTLICIFISPLTSVFTSNAEVATLVGSLLVPFVIYQAGDCLQIIYANALRGIESVKRMILYAFVAYIVVSLPMSYIFAFVLDYGAVGVWYGIPFGLTTAGILFYREFDLQTRRMIK